LIREKGILKFRKLSTLMNTLKNEYFMFEDLQGASRKVGERFTYTFTWKNHLTILEESASTRQEAREIATLTLLQRFAPLIHEHYAKEYKHVPESGTNCIEISSDEGASLFDKLRRKVQPEQVTPHSLTQQRSPAQGPSQSQAS
jgi:hypothetical protein